MREPGSEQADGQGARIVLFAAVSGKTFVSAGDSQEPISDPLS